MKKDSSDNLDMVKWHSLRKFIALFTAACVLCVPLNAYATNAQDKINSAQNSINSATNAKKDAQNKLDEANKKADALAKESAALQKKIAAQEEELAQLIMEIEILEEDITRVKAEIAQAEADLKEAEETAAHQYEMMKVRIVYMYEKQEENVFSSLVESKTISDFLNRAEYINDVYNYDRNLLDEYEATVARIDSLRLALIDQRHELEDAQTELERAKADEEQMIATMEAELTDVNAALSSAKSKAASYKKTIEEQNKLIRDAQDKLAAAQKEQKEQQAAAAAASKKDNNSTSSDSDSDSDSSSASSGGGPSVSIPASGTGAEIARYGLQFVGCPYVFGGNSLTNGCDCSGFVNLCYAAYGIRVARDSYSLRDAGVAVSYADAAPGDIVCYSGHVAIYIGNGQIVHAKNSQSGICVDNILYDRRGIICIRRVV